MSGLILCKPLNPRQLLKPPPMFPPLTDVVALLGINLVLCAGCLRLLSCRHGVTRWAKWGTAVFFVALWCPVGAALLPIVAYLRGLSSDPSMTLVMLACLALLRSLSGFPAIAKREQLAVFAAVAAAAVFLYPLALGWGDWDAYRLGWGAPGMWVALLVVSLVCWLQGLRLLPMLVVVALLAWTAGLLESTNLWDYLLDPWLAIIAIFHCSMTSCRKLLQRFGRARSGTAFPSSS